MSKKYKSNLSNRCHLAGKHLLRSHDLTVETARHVLSEASHAIATENVLVYRKGLVFTIKDGYGETRVMTVRETIAYLILGNTEIRP